MSRERKIQLFSLVLIAGCIGLAGVFRETVLSVDPPAHAKPEPPMRKPPSVEYVTPRTGSIRRAVRMAAEIRPYREAMIYGQVAGYVQAHPVEVGTRVDASTVLLEIDAPELDAAVTTAKSSVARSTAAIAESEAAVVEAQQGLAEAKAKATQAQGMIKVAEAHLVEERADLETKQKIFDRVERVRTESPNMMSQDRVDRARGEFGVAKAQTQAAEIAVRGAQDNYKVAQARVAAAKARITAAEAGVTAAKAQEKLAMSKQAEAEAREAFTTIKAPFSGVVAERMVDTGNLVMDATRNSAAMPLFRVVSDDRLRARFFLAEPDCPHVKVGNDVELYIDVLPGKVYKGTITRIADALDPKTRTMEVEAELDNPKGPDGKKVLRTDMFARVKVYLEQYENTLILPADCVKTKKRKSTVLVIQDDDTVQPIEVQIGVDDGKEIQIVSTNINTSSRIVFKGGGKVAAGEKVTPTAAKN